MLLAEALSIRSDLQKRIEQISPRLNASCRVQEGDEPAENPAEIFKELQDCLSQLEQLVIRINKTNELTVLANGRSITEMIARRDMLKQHCSVLQELLNNLTQRAERYTRSEIRYVNTVDVSELRRKSDELSKSLRETDMQIQAANWATELCD